MAYQHLSFPEGTLFLVTGHRRENFGNGFISMVTMMKVLSEK